jgi:hypothetical protein
MLSRIISLTSQLCLLIAAAVRNFIGRLSRFLLSAAASFGVVVAGGETEWAISKVMK